MLIAEDSVTQAAVLKDALERHGWHVRVAGDGAEALAMARVSKPAIVVSDIRMPKIDGYALSKAIKTDPALHDVPVVLLTSLSQSHDIIDAVNSRADYYFLKQWDYEVLVAKIASVLDTYQPFPEHSQGGLTVRMEGETYTIEANAQQPLRLLLSTYEIAVQQSMELARSRDELREHRDHLEEVVAERTAALEERRKEVSCLYSVSNLVAEPCLSVDAALTAAVALIPAGFEHAANARARIVCDGKEFAAADFGGTGRTLSADILRAGETIGRVEVAYLDEQPPGDQGPFLRQEQEMLDDIARQLAVMVERCRVEQALRASENRYRRLFEAAKDGILILDAETGIVVDANPFLVELLGFPRQEFCGKALWELGSFKDVVANQAKFDELRKRGYVRYADLPLQAADGRQIDVEFVSNVYPVDGHRVIQCNIRNVTEQKRAAEALRASEELRRRIIESSRDCIQVLDLDGRLLSMSPGGQELLEIADTQPYLGRNWADFWNGEDRESALAAIATATNGGTGQFEGYGETEKGKPAWWEVIVSPICGKENRVENLLAVSRSCTERKEKEKQQQLAMQVLTVLNRRNDVSLLVGDILDLVKQSTGFEVVAVRLRDGDDYPYYVARGLSEAFVAVGGALCSRDGDGRLVRDADGRPALQCVCGKVIRGSFDPARPFFTESGSFWTNSLTELLATTAEEDRRAFARTRCRDEGYESMALVPLRSGDSVVGLLQISDRRKEMLTLGMIQFLEEMSAGIGIAVARKRAADELLTVAKFPAENPGPVLRIAEDGTLLYANAAALSQLGTWQLRLGQAAPPVLRDVACLSSDQGAQRTVDAECEGRTYAFTATPIIAAGYVNLYGRDITARLRLEAQLHQAAKLESIGRLAGGVAHDFNNMIAVIRGNAELTMAEMAPDDPLTDNVREIHQAAGRSADLTRQLLAFARKQIVAPAALDLNEAVSGMLKMLQRLLGENIHLCWQPFPQLWPVYIDPSQIDQILANLCVNARDAMSDQGKLTVETRNTAIDEDYSAAHADAIPGDYVQLSVSDDGCGMDRDTLARVFEPFFTTKELGKGTGLGLATVYGVVKQNHGFINVYSEPGEGTTFSIYLPRHGETSEQGAAKVRAEALVHGHETILLVEDELSILRVTTAMLRKLGYTVLSASTAREAIRLAQEHTGHIDLLLTDVIMPEMNGRGLAKELSGNHPDLKCLFMSGYTANVIAHHGVLDGGVLFLQKPFSTEELARKVREALVGVSQSEPPQHG